MPIIHRVQILLIAFIACVLFPTAAHSQVTVVNKGSRHYLQRIGQEEHVRINPFGQQILREYALALATNPLNLSPVFQCEINRESTVSAQGEVVIRFRIINGTVRGDHELKGFDISDVLMPTLFNATILLTNNRGDTLLRETQRGLRLNKGNSAFVRYQVDAAPLKDTLWFEVKDLFFTHERQGVQNLINRIQKIADYYAADYLLERIQKQLATVNTRQYDLLPESFISLMEAQRVLQHIGKANFSEALSLGINDPANLSRRHEVASNTYAYLMREFDNTLRQTSRIYLTQTEESLIMMYIDGITKYIDDNPEPGFAAQPFINQLSSLDYAGKEFDQQANYFRQIAARIYNDIPAVQAAEKFLGNVYEAMIRKAGDYMTAVEFTKAVVLFENAARFCSAFPEVECSEQAQFDLAKAKHGLYGFYLSVADRAIEMQRPDIGSYYTFLARDYQRKNRKLIIHDGDVMIMLVKLFDAYVLEASRHNNSERYDSALMILTRAVQPDIGITPSFAWHLQNSKALNGILARRLNTFASMLNGEPLASIEVVYHTLAHFVNSDMAGVALSADNELRYRELQARFVKILGQSAKYDMDGGLFEESMRKLLLAKSILGDRNMPLNPEIDSLAIIAGREVIRQMLQATVALINQGKTDDAFNLFSEATLRAEYYGLQRDEVTKARLDEIYDAYISIRCAQLQSRFDQVVLRAERLAELKLFIQAGDTITSAMNQLLIHKACRFSFTAAQALISRYQYPAAFQQALIDAERAYEQKDFITCLRHIENAELLYQQYDLQKFGLDPFTMMDYAFRHRNNSLNWFIARRFVQLLRFDQALRALELLREGGSTSAETQEIQEELGSLMGFKDRNEVSFLQSFTKPKEFTGGDSWYKPFHKAYRKGLGHRFPWFFQKRSA